MERRVRRWSLLLLLTCTGALISCRMAGSDPRAGDNIDVPPERPGRDFPEAAEAEERREREADYSKPAGPELPPGTHGYEPAPNVGVSAPKPGTRAPVPDTEVIYGKPQRK